MGSKDKLDIPLVRPFGVLLTTDLNEMSVIEKYWLLNGLYVRGAGNDDEALGLLERMEIVSSSQHHFPSIEWMAEWERWADRKIEQLKRVRGS